MTRRALILLVSTLAVALQLPGCTLVGPPAIANGRSAYSKMINQTEDEQVLDIILRERYDETFGMLSVASVTASISLRSSVGGNVGLGPDSSYDGNLVPLSLGFAYEENPTISYVPLGGEIFYQRTLTPVTLEHTLLMARASENRTSIFRLMIERINGIENPPPGRKPASDEFDELAEAFTVLHDGHLIDLMHAKDGEQYFLLVHDYEGKEQRVQTVIDTLGLDPVELEGQPLMLPVSRTIGAPDGQITLETRSALDVIRVIGDSIDIPKKHLEEGIVEPVELKDQEHEFLRIRSSATRPEFASVATLFHGYWFYIDSRDTKSKRGFVLIRTLIGMRLYDADARSQAPTLTIPVG